MSLAQMAAAKTPEDLEDRFGARRQAHVFRFLPDLDAAARSRLLAQAAAIDLEALEKAFRRARHPEPLGDVAPPPVERLPEHGGDPALRARAREAGEELHAEGRVAALVVAGGQGTRLGHAGPKGTYPLGPVSGRTLFALQAQKIRRLRRRYGRTMPWYVMTSAATDAATRTYFAREAWLGVGEENVFFFAQRQLPCLDFDGRLMLAGPDRIAESPDGHGGVIAALRVSGALEDAENRGISVISYYQVDNPLVPIGDSVLVGLHALRGAEMTSKAVSKRRPDENVGTLVRRGGRVSLIEYTEIQEPIRSSRDERGELVFWAGAIGVHALDVKFVARLAERADVALPCHLSPKRIRTVDASGRPVEPADPNGFKLERFVFDALPLADRPVLLEVRREDEYSPLKNATGGESPATARRDLNALVRRWLEEADVKLPGPQVPLEVDHQWIDSVEDCRRLGITRIEQAGDAVLVGESG